MRVFVSIAVSLDTAFLRIHRHVVIKESVIVIREIKAPLPDDAQYAYRYNPSFATTRSVGAVGTPVADQFSP